jgi:hypothetical protein
LWEGEIPTVIQDVRVWCSPWAFFVPIVLAIPFLADRMLPMADSSNKVGQTLTKASIFSSLTEGELEFLAKRTVLRRYSTGELVFGEG